MSTINIYSSNSINQWDLLPNKLFIIDDIADYLLTKTKTTLTNVQYQKNQLELTLKLDMSQAMAQADSVSNYKYLSIQNNSDERIHYYFVRKASWKSQNCVQFDLLLDVLNTFHETTDYDFKPNTKIIREHKDRYVKGLYEIIISVDYLPTKTGNINEGDHASLISRFDQKVMFSGTITEISLGFSIITIEVDGEYFDKLVTIKADLLAHENSPYSLDVTNNDYLMYSAIIENDYTFNLREHRVIDYISEGINPMLYHIPSEDVTIENPKAILAQNWYLLYKNQNDPSESLTNPVECYLIPENATEVNVANITDGILPINAFEVGNEYWLRFEDGNTNTFSLADGTTLGAVSGYDDVYYIIKRDSHNRLIVNVYGGITGVTELYHRNTYETTHLVLNDLPQEFIVAPFGITLNYSSTNLTYNNATKQYWTNTSLNTTLNSINDLDRTDAKLIKLIKLPYCPYNFVVSGNKLDISSDTNWLYTTLVQSGSFIIALKLQDLNIKLNGEFSLPLSAQVFSALGGLHLSPSLTLLRNNTYEPKIYHSEFYSPTFVYDSFVLKFELEKCDLNYYINNKSYNASKLKFVVTSTINSRFMFVVANYQCKFSESNFYNMFTIARNNEEVLYNTPYINFIRNGFNYEVKSKNIQNTANWVGAGLGVVGGIGGIALGVVAKNPLAVVGGVVSIVSSLKGAITTQVQSENAMAQKLDQLRNQIASATGSDDVDLMSIYAKNRVILMTYKPNELMTNMLYDLFFYAGYASGRMGIPNHTRRVNFDYLECEAKIESLTTIPEDCLNELIACFATGVTYIHKTSRTSKKWDVKQEYENWEKFLFD